MDIFAHFLAYKYRFPSLFTKEKALIWVDIVVGDFVMVRHATLKYENKMAPQRIGDNYFASNSGEI